MSKRGEQGEGKPPKTGVPFVESGFIFAHSVYTDIVPSNHFTSCAPGASYEMGNPKGANTKPPWDSSSLGRLFYVEISVSIPFSFVSGVIVELGAE